MATRTTRKTVTFAKPFQLSALDGVQPGGQYLVDTDEERIDGISRLAYRRLATSIHLPAISAASNLREVIAVDPGELEAALLEDRCELV
jgi:hypothetical protein